MPDFSEFKKYVFDDKNDDWNDSKHAFFKFDLSILKKVTDEIKMSFPKELVDFYEQIGYGFVCNNKSSVTSRIMDPKSIADFILGRGYYQMFDDKERFTSNDKFPFFEVSELSILTFDLSQANKTNEYPVYYYDKKIAHSLLQFLQKMDEKVDYYLR
jgi:hypothetical protein